MHRAAQQISGAVTLGIDVMLRVDDGDNWDIAIDSCH